MKIVSICVEYMYGNVLLKLYEHMRFIPKYKPPVNAVKCNQTACLIF